MCIGPELIVMNVYTVFLVHPASIVAVNGSTVEFTCTANNSDIIRLMTIGLQFDLPSIGRQCAIVYDFAYY